MKACAEAMAAKSVTRKPELKGQDRPPQQRTFEIDIMSDSGAGRLILCRKELQKQAVPVSLLDKNTRQASQEVTFVCGGGDVEVNRSI